MAHPHRASTSRFGNRDIGGRSDPDIDDLNDDGSDGWYSDAALRSQLLPQLEVSAGVRYSFARF